MYLLEHLGQKSENCGSLDNPVFVNKVVLEHNHNIHLHIVEGCFPELGVVTDCMTCKDSNMLQANKYSLTA